MPGLNLGAWDSFVNKTGKEFCPRGAYILVEKADNKNIKYIRR